MGKLGIHCGDIRGLLNVDSPSLGLFFTGFAISRQNYRDVLMFLRVSQINYRILKRKYSFEKLTFKSG